MTCIVGAGPAGLTAALLLARHGHTVTLLDANADLGGCHRVVRTGGVPSGLFAEHAPRVYSSAYTNVRALLHTLGTTWDAVFVTYRFGMLDIGGTAWSHLSMRELAWLAWAFVRCNVLSSDGAMSVAEFAAQHGFSVQAQDYLDRLCRLTDGAGADRYSLWLLMSMANQTGLHTLYQLRQPSDVGLFALWRQRLQQAGVRIVNDCTVLSVEQAGHGQFTVACTGRQVIKARTVILAVPPHALSAIRLPAGTLPARFSSWARATNYVAFVSGMLYFAHRPEKAAARWGFPATPWAIVYVVTTDYTYLGDDLHALSFTASRLDVATATSNAANECTAQEVVAEVYRQLAASVGGLPALTHGFLTPGMQHNGSQWVNPNSAWIHAAHTAPWGPATGTPGVFSLGVHNGGRATGVAPFVLTSMEAAVLNALALVNLLRTVDLQPAVTIRQPLTITRALTFICVLLAVVGLGAKMMPPLFK